MTLKIERTIVEIARTKEKIAKFQDKLRALEQQKIFLENEEIVALCRKERLTEDDLITYIMERREAVNDAQPAPILSPPPDAAAISAEDRGGHR